MTPQSFYNKKKEDSAAELKRLKRISFSLSMLRLTVFIAITLSFYFFWGAFELIGIIGAIGFVLFLFLVSRYADIKNKQRYFQKLVEINQLELDVLNGDFSKLQTGNEFIYEEHHYNQDIDLFGDGSLFQHINRTETANGKRTLAHWLNSNQIDHIQLKQEAIQELSKKTTWRQHFKATAALVETEVPSNSVVKWINEYVPFVPSLFTYLPIIFSLFSLSVFGLYGFGVIPSSYLLYWLLVGIFISGFYVKRITKLYNTANQVKDTFAQYAKLLEAVEKEKFESNLLKAEQEKIKTEGLNASDVLKNLSKQIDYLGNRNNMIFAPLANGFFLWDLYYSRKIELWLNKFDHSVSNWFSAIETFDAMSSMANYAFNHPEYIYPQISGDERTVLSSKELAHPLLDANKVVRNGIEINKEDFFIITGANMAGKSTFLRTVALNLVIANCGLPVSAVSFVYTPIKLISSMRTSDSLQNDESYFFSELKRLKFIVDEMKTDAYFIILDEILKGTNSKDKAEGSQKFVEKLVASNSTGLIATHDLSLCQLAEKLPQVQNYYFDADIVDDELYFDYTFKIGICQNMNASFLLKKMEIV